MAAKIVRQPNRLILLGSPTSAAALSAGHEGAPAALRSAGLAARLRSIGYEVEDLGDDPVQLSRTDEENPRTRNVSGVLAVLNALKPRVELAVKAGALPLILSGDCSVALATIAGVRRYFRNVGLVYLDSDADLNTPATTESGCLDGMVVSHVTGRGAPELVRFWSEPPLVRDPDVVLFGAARFDPSERQALERSTLRRYLAADVERMGAAPAARAALERIHGDKDEFVLHFGVDAIAGFAATNYPAEAGLTYDRIREALEIFVSQPRLAAVEIAAYNPAKDADGSGAKQIIDLLADVLAKRLEALASSAAPAEKKVVPEADVIASGVVEPAAAPRVTDAESGSGPYAPSAPGEASSSNRGHVEDAAAGAAPPDSTQGGAGENSEEAKESSS